MSRVLFVGPHLDRPPTYRSKAWNPLPRGFQRPRHIAGGISPIHTFLRPGLHAIVPA